MMLTRVHAVYALLIAGLGLNSAEAQCFSEELTVSTETTFHVRQLVEQNACEGVGATPFFVLDDGNFVQWTAATSGSLRQQDSSTEPGLRARFSYLLSDFVDALAYSEIVLTISQSYLDANPNGFVVSSDQQIPSGEGVTWVINGIGTAPAISFEGTVTRSENGSLILDVTYSSGVVNEETPSGAISELIEFIGGAPAIEGGLENALVSSLEAAIQSVEAGNYNAATGQLTALINKVEAVRSKKIFDEVADDIIAAANEILALLQ